MPIDEDGFLQHLFSQLKLDSSVIIPPGDDCAAIPLTDETLLLLTVDQVADGIHYFARTGPTPTPPRAVGRKLLARNVSDIAAMGGSPTFALLAIALERKCEPEWLEEFARGVVDASHKYGIQLVGGDICAANTTVSSLTLLGTVASDRVCTRQGAQAGDAIFVTGRFGLSLQTGKHLHFTPRLAEGKWIAEHGYATAMIDTSDGLLHDLQRICTASEVTAVIDEDDVPRTETGGKLASMSQACLDGEDYELIFGVSQDKQTELLRTWPFSTNLTQIGHFKKTSQLFNIKNVNNEDIVDKYGPGFDHFTVPQTA